MDVYRSMDYLTKCQSYRTYYKHYDDVDLYVGGLLEKPLNGSMLGLTFLCIIGDTFARLRCGDRFFYDLDADPVVMFSGRQLRELRKTSLARSELICTFNKLYFECYISHFGLGCSVMHLTFTKLSPEPCICQTMMSTDQCFVQSMINDIGIYFPPIIIIFNLSSTNLIPEMDYSVFRG